MFTAYIVVTVPTAAANIAAAAAELMRAHWYSHLPRSVLFLLLAMAALVLDLSS